MYEELKGLKVFSKKLGRELTVASDGGAILLEDPGKRLFTALAWQDQGWSNTGDNWIDKGWANSGRWIDSGWSNSHTWTDGGWNNSDHWTDGGWSNDGGGCYVSTACIEQMGLDDNCEELQILRKYRDILVEQDEGFREEVLDYYRKAPVLVQKILRCSDREEILTGLYKDLVQKCVSLLKAGEYDKAKQHYVNTYHSLLGQFGC